MRDTNNSEKIQVAVERTKQLTSTITLNKLLIDIIMVSADHRPLPMISRNYQAFPNLVLLRSDLNPIRTRENKSQ